MNDRMDVILIADVGGTNTRVACVPSSPSEAARGDTSEAAIQHYKNSEHSDFEEILTEYRATGHGLEAGRVRRIVIAVAAPVQGTTATLTNLSWRIDSDQIAARFDAPVTLINDLHAFGYGVLAMDRDRLTTLQRGTPAPGNAGLVVVGTGLGEGLLFWNGEEFQPQASEGGHSDFGPQNRSDRQLLEFLTEKYQSDSADPLGNGHVSWERVVSGRDGLRNLYQFWQRRYPHDPLVEAVAGQRDLGPTIVSHARQGSMLARQVIDDFYRLLAAEAGNLALKIWAIGGIYLGGSLLNETKDLLPKRRFLDSFQNKGRFSQTLAQIPIYIVPDDDIVLLGCRSMVANGL